MAYIYEYMKDFSKKSIVLKLLNNEPILCFLHKEFVENGQRDYIPATELGDHWESFRRNILKEDSSRSGMEVVREWMKQDQMYLEGTHEQNTGIFRYRLMPDVYLAFRMFEDLQGSGDAEYSVPVDSYFNEVTKMIRELSYANGSNPEEQVALLDKQIQDLRLRIKDLLQKKRMIKKGIPIDLMDDVTMTNRVRHVLQMLRRMPADISSIADYLHKLYIKLGADAQRDDMTRNSLMDMVVSERKKIDDSVQGATFRNFMLYIHQHNSDGLPLLDELLDALRSLGKNPKLAPIVQKERPWEILLDIANSVENASRETHGIWEMVETYISSDVFQSDREIRKLLGRVRSCYADLQGVSRLRFPPLYIFEKPERPVSQMASVIDVSVGDTVSAVVIKPMRKHDSIVLEDDSVDSFRLYGNLSNAVEQNGRVSLSHLLARFPLDKGNGVEELFTYLGNRDFKTAESGKKIQLDIYNGFHKVVEHFELDDVEFSRRV